MTHPFFFQTVQSQQNKNNILAAQTLLITNPKFQLICEVSVLKRVQPHHTNFDSVEIRLGHVNKAGTGLSHLGEDNPLIGYHEGATTTMDFVLNLEPGVDGRYLTFQTMVAQLLGFDEVHAKAMK